MPVVSSGGTMVGSQWMNAIGVGAPTALRSGCENGETVRVAFALDCCDREAMSFLATTGGITGEDVRDLMVAAVEHRFGTVNRLPVTIEWLSDNGSCYVAGDTPSFARDVGFEPRTTPIENPQSNGNGRGLRSNDQARLRPHQPMPGRPDRDATVVIVDRPLQRGSPA